MQKKTITILLLWFFLFPMSQKYFSIVLLINKPKNRFLKELSLIREKFIRFAMRMLSDKNDAEDVVQDFYEKIWRKDLLAEVKNKEAFAMKMVRNACLDFLRKKQLTIVSDSNEPLQLEADPQQLLEVSEGYRLLDKILAGLSEKQRTVFHLRDIEGYELEKIAEVLKITNEAVRANLSRARKQIREAYQKYRDDER